MIILIDLVYCQRYCRAGQVVGMRSQVANFDLLLAVHHAQGQFEDQQDDLDPVLAHFDGLKVKG